MPLRGALQTLMRRDEEPRSSMNVYDTRRKTGHKHALHAKDHHHHAHGSSMSWMQILQHGELVTHLALYALCINICLMLVKWAAAAWLQSFSLLAEASHALSDTLTDILTLVCLYKARQKPTTKYPLGYAKMEPLGSFFSSAMLLLTSVGIGAQALAHLATWLIPSNAWIGQLLSWTWIYHDDMHHHNHQHQTTSIIYAVISIVLSILVKEAVFRMLKNAAQSARSSVLEASALHQRMESLASAMSLVTIAATWFGYAWLDPIGGMIRAVYNGKDAWALLVESVDRLCDCSAGDEWTRRIEHALEQAAHCAVNTSDMPAFTWSELLVVTNGSALTVYVTLTLPPQITRQKALAAESFVREYIGTHHNEVRIFLRLHTRCGTK